MRRPLLSILLAAALLPAARAADAEAAPASLSARTVEGQPLSLAALRGRVVLLLYWSTDCPVCLDKLPELRRNLEGWNGKPFTIVAVSQDRAEADLRAYVSAISRTTPPHPQLQFAWRRDSAHHDSFGELPTRVPSTFIIDPSGRVVRRIQGRIPPEVWNDIADLVVNR